MTELFRQALDQAERDLVNLDAAAEEMELKRARLRQTISVLRGQLGLPAANNPSLTDSILTVVKAWNGFATAAEVFDRLVIMGYHVQSATVASILSRMAKNGLVISGRSTAGTGYAWREPLTPSDALAAMGEVMKKSNPCK
jgi:hypothetical protein